MSLMIVSFSFQLNFSQSFINGDFENVTSVDCEYNLPDATFNKRIANVTAFGKTYFLGKQEGEADILTSGCYVEPQNGQWCIGLASDYHLYTTSDAIAIELTSNLVPDKSYKLTFYLYGNISFSDSLTNIKIGESLNNSTFGVLIDTVTPDPMGWKYVDLEFKSQQNSKFITVQNIPGTNGWNQIDNFTLSMTTSNAIVESQNTSGLNIFPNPATDFVNISVKSFDNNSTFNIIDMSGRTLLNGKLNCDYSTINIQQLPSGLYFINVISQIIQTIKLIKS